MKKAIALIRVSTESQAADDRAGIPAQRAAIQRIAQQYQLEIVRTIELTDVSGTAVLRAPEMQELLRLIESPEIHGVIAREFSRLMRPERFEDFVLLQGFADTQTVLYLPDGPLDLASKSGSLMGGLRALMAGFERREILDRMNGAKEAMRLAGKHAGGRTTLPFGVAYNRATGVWSYTPAAEKLKEAYRLMVTTPLPFAQIAERLNLSRSNLRYMLSNPIYTGVRVYTQKRDQATSGYIPGQNGRQGYRRKVNRAADEVIRVRVMDGLVSDEVFQRVQQIISSRVTRQRTIRAQNAPRYVLNGFLNCGHCGEVMYSHTNKKADYYRCRRNGTRDRSKGYSCDTPYIMASRIEPKIECVLSDLLQDRALLADVAQAYSSHQQPEVAAVNHNAAQQQVKALQAKRERVMDAFFEGLIAKPELDSRLAQIDAEIAAFGDMLTPHVQPAQPTVTVESLSNLLSVFTEFRFLQRDEKRALLTETQAQIFVEGYEIKSIAVAGIQPDNDFNKLQGSDIASRLPEAAS